MWNGRQAVDPDPSNLLRVLGGSFTVVVDVTVEGEDGTIVHHTELEGPRGLVQVLTTGEKVRAWLMS